MAQNTDQVVPLGNIDPEKLSELEKLFGPNQFEVRVHMTRNSNYINTP